MYANIGVQQVFHSKLSVFILFTLDFRISEIISSELRLSSHLPKNKDTSNFSFFPLNVWVSLSIRFLLDRSSRSFKYPKYLSKTLFEITKLPIALFLMQFSYFFKKSTFYYSHSIVAGGLELMSYTTLLTPFTRFIILFEVSCKNS